MLQMHQAVRMANEQQPSRGQHAEQTNNELTLRFRLKINKDITTKNNMKRLLNGIKVLKKVNAFQPYFIAYL